MNKYRKLFAFLKIYGLKRTLVKAIGRTRFPVSFVRRSKVGADIAMIGCGQFAFSTIGYFLSSRFGARFGWCYDVDAKQRDSFARFYKVKNAPAEAHGWNEDPQVRYVYIASNHASHTSYAIDALQSGKTVYVEKPVSVTFEQLSTLERTREDTAGVVFSGYNRPHSKAVKHLRSCLGEQPSGGITLCCFVSGHVIPADHWYRDPGEGTRICGNAGHWIDLFLHMCHWRDRLPDHFSLKISPASQSDPDDNFALTVTTDMDDVFTLVLTSRSEPFEGINETVSFQQDTTIASIADFRAMTVWQGEKSWKKRFWPKDVGHRAAALQPFAASPPRPWIETVRSSCLTLSFAEMVQKGERERTVSLSHLMAEVATGYGSVE